MTKLLLLIIAFLFIGCGDSTLTRHTKVRITFKCVNGVLVGDSYLYSGHNANEDITKHLVKTNELVMEEGIKIWCENIKAVK